MPTLDPEERAVLLTQTTIPCLRCGALVWCNYCRECDEFFFVCRACGRQTDHVGHRTYDW